MTTFKQGINEHLDYSIDWDRVLVGLETLSSADWTVPAPLTSDNPSILGTLTTIFLAGGVVGRTYEISCEVTTSAPRTFERAFKLKIVEVV